MYEDRYGIDWSTLTDEELIERAYALGVAESIGERHNDELDRLKAETSVASNRNLIDLAYDEGRTRAAKAVDQSDKVDDDVWDTLVTETEIEFVPRDTGSSPEPGDRTERENTRAASAIDRPTVIDRIEILEPPERDGRIRLRLPEFL